MSRQTTHAVFKITTASDWTVAETSGQFSGSRDDVRDGYIHLSTAAQARETAARHFAGQDGLVLVALDALQLGAVLKWEPSRGGALFPHLYAPLRVALVLWVKPLPRDAAGRHIFPLEIE